MRTFINFYKRNVLLVTSFVALVLVVVAVLSTSLFLRSERSVSPTAPESRPRALDGNPVPACEFTLTIAQPSPTPPPQCSSQCSSDTECPSELRCLPVSTNPNGLKYCLNPQCQSETDCLCNPSPTPTPTPTASPVAQCLSQCTSDANCPSTLRCLPVSANPNGLKYCLNPLCQAETDCLCKPSPTPTPSTSPTPTPSSVGGPQCGTTCNNSSQCASNMICYFGPGATLGLCRNYECPTSGNCVCASVSPTPQVTPSVIPQVPVTGTSFPTAILAAGGILLLIISVAFIL